MGQISLKSERVPHLRRFHLRRDEDVSGVSGHGRVAVGAELPTGRIIMEWIVGPVRSLVVYGSIQDVSHVHGHDGKTVVVWDDPE